MIIRHLDDEKFLLISLTTILNVNIKDTLTLLRNVHQRITSKKSSLNDFSFQVSNAYQIYVDFMQIVDYVNYINYNPQN